MSAFFALMRLASQSYGQPGCHARRGTRRHSLQIRDPRRRAHPADGVERLLGKGDFYAYLTTLDDIIASRGGNPLIVALPTALSAARRLPKPVARRIRAPSDDERGGAARG